MKSQNSEVLQRHHITHSSQGIVQQGVCSITHTSQTHQVQETRFCLPTPSYSPFLPTGQPSRQYQVVLFSFSRLWTSLFNIGVISSETYGSFHCLLQLPAREAVGGDTNGTGWLTCMGLRFGLLLCCCHETRPPGVGQGQHKDSRISVIAFGMRFVHYNTVVSGVRATGGSGQKRLH